MSNLICHYGCGRIAIKQNKSGNWMCDTSCNKCPEIKRKNKLAQIKSYASGKRMDSKTIYKNLSEDTKKNMAWNRGLTKNTDNRVLKNSISSANARIGKTKNPHTPETKRKISEKRIAFLENNSKHCEWYSICGIKVQGSLEKKLAEFFLKHNIEFERKKLAYQKHRRYTPDFYLPTYGFYIEVKGFLYEKDKEKYRNVLLENQVDIRIAFKNDIDNLLIASDLKSLKKLSECIKDINYSKFKNHWEC